MDLREAFEKLGVEPTEDTKSVRRAYLRLVKKHKPETDPEGFQRIRAAWERIKDAPEWEVRSLLEPRSETSPSEPASGGWSSPKRNWAEQAQMSLAGRLFDGPAPPPRQRPEPTTETGEGPSLGIFYERCNGASDAERVAIGREAIAVLPDEPEAYWLLHDALLVTSQMSEAAEALRTAHRRGLPGFLEPLLRQHPEHLSTEEIREAQEQAGQTISALTVADCLLRVGNAEGAAEAMRRGLEAGRMGQTEHVPSIHMSVDFVLRLYREHHAGVATQLFERLATWLRESGRESEIHGTQVAATYALLKELAALPSSFPSTVRAHLARAVLDGDATFAVPDVLTWLDQHPKQRPEIEEKLVVFAPTLHTAVRPALEIAKQGPPQSAAQFPPRPQPAAWRGGGGGPVPKQQSNFRWVGWLAAFFFFIALRIAIGSSSSSSYRPPDLSYLENLPRFDQNQLQLGAPTDESLRTAASGLCIWDQLADECRYGRGLADALIGEDCEIARDQMGGLDLAMEILTDPASPTRDQVAIRSMLMTRNHETLRRGLQHRCPTGGLGIRGDSLDELNELGEAVRALEQDVEGETVLEGETLVPDPGVVGEEPAPGELIIGGSRP